VLDLLLVAIFGVAFGSFLNVLIVRIPKGESIIFGSSHCTKCGGKLRFYHNIPLLSYIFLGGKCSFCKEKISPRYPIVEALSGVVALLLVHKLSLSLPAMFVIASFFMLITLSFIDLEFQLVPDSINLLAIIFAIFGAWSVGGVMLNFQNALIIAGGFTLLRFSLSYILTKSARIEASKHETSWSKNYHTYGFIEAMGEGDIMVAATMGALLGIQLSLVAIFLSALLALPILLYLQFKHSTTRVAFVPFLSIATLIVYYFDTECVKILGALL